MCLCTCTALKLGINTTLSYFKEIKDSKELIVNLTMREVKGQYKRTFLGQLWSFANPLAQMIIYTFVFAFIFRVQPAPGDPSGLQVFPLWLLCGLLPWVFFVTVINRSMGSIIDNASLIQKVAFPRAVLPLSTLGSALYNWTFEMGFLVVALIIAGAMIWIWLPLIIIAMLLLAIFAVGLGMVISIANVHFRDTQYLVSVLLNFWMYLTPVVYPISLIAVQSEETGPLFGTNITLLDIYRLNPMERFIEVFRNLMYDNRLPELGTSIYVVTASFVMLFLGLLVFSKNEKNLAEVL